MKRNQNSIRQLDHYCADHWKLTGVCQENGCKALWLPEKTSEFCKFCTLLSIQGQIGNTSSSFSQVPTSKARDVWDWTSCWAYYWWIVGCSLFQNTTRAPGVWWPEPKERVDRCKAHSMKLHRTTEAKSVSVKLIQFRCKLFPSTCLLVLSGYFQQHSGVWVHPCESYATEKQNYREFAYHQEKLNVTWLIPTMLIQYPKLVQS